jgi:hypothetical protein
VAAIAFTSFALKWRVMPFGPRPFGSVIYAVSGDHHVPQNLPNFRKLLDLSDNGLPKLRAHAQYKAKRTQ